MDFSGDDEMQPQAKAFKRVAAQGCRDRGFPLAKFMDEWNLEEILMQANEHDHSATQIAAAVLWRCCCTDGRFNNFHVGFLSVAQHLREQKGDIGTQPFQDLASIMKAGTTEAAIETWMETHFP
jgi:hypothetical protein